MNRISNRSAITLTLRAGIVLALFFGPLNRSNAGPDMPTSTGQSNQKILVTTTESIEGFQIKDYKGIVRGVTVREPGPVSNFKVSLKSIVGGKMSPYIRLCETAREQAFDVMVERAQALGANAVVAFRYDSSAYGDNDGMGTEVVCYGTAVTVVPKDAALRTVSMRQPEQ